MVRLAVLVVFALLVSAACSPPGETADSADEVPGGDAPSGLTDSPDRTDGATSTRQSERGSDGSDPPVVVLFLGTSLTAGYGLAERDDRFTARLQALARREGLPVEVVNAGVSGETSSGALRRLDWVLRSDPDVVVVETGGNDGLRGLDVEALESNLRGIVRGVREQVPDARIVLLGMEAPTNMGARYTEAFREVYRRVARTEDVALVPFLLEGVAAVPELNQDDRIHPNAAGHRVIARDVLWPVLEPILRAAVADRGSTASSPAAGSPGPAGGTP